MNYDHTNLIFKMLIPNSLSKKAKGDFFEEVTACLFRQRGLEITHNIRLPGVQIDIGLEDKDTKSKAAVECKFHKDKIGSDEVGKIISILSTYDFSRGFLLSASELEGEGRTFADNFNQKNNNKLTVWAGKDLVEIFINAYHIEKPNLDRLGNVSVSRITFLITYEKEFVWVLEKIDDDIENSQVFIIPTKLTRNYSKDYWKDYFQKFDEYQKYNLTVIDNNNLNTNVYQAFNIARESEFKKMVIPRIRKADKFDEYHLPCNPEDFVGRLKPKEIFWEFIKEVKDNQADSRIVCLTGNTGVGKSSLLVKLIEESSQEEYKFLHIRGIDISGVNDNKAKYFLANAIQTTLQEAIDKEFINIPNHQIKIDSLEYPFFESDSINLLRNKLREESKIIVMFFDQFEEVLTKNSWESMYEDFREVANEINYIQENIVFGFSWREDVSISPNNPKYHFWQKIKRSSKIIDLNKFMFSEKDTEQVLKKFENFLINNTHIKRLEDNLKYWLSDNCQNMPWLLKKICYKIYDEYDETVNLVDYTSIEKIFDRDRDNIKAIGENYYDCLKYIAVNSPVSIEKVRDKYGDHIIYKLLSNRLVIETESNYKIYADIFREYIINGTLPSLNIRFKPNTRILIAIQVFHLLNSNLTKFEVANKLNLTYQINKTDTVDHAIRDLQKFLPLEPEKNSGLVKVSENFRKLTDYEIAEKLADYLVADILVSEIYRKYQPDERFTRDQFDQILLENEYVSNNGDIKDYRRCLSWFLFAGLLEIRHDQYIYIPINSKKGKQKGKASDCDLKNQPRIQKSQQENYQPNLLDFLERINTDNLLS
ncbi:restriction endonuclease [Trichormus sp. NMC-1]|uniref:restriction endonuclease n=1 Tax=Trichormus sp. NMC-1 TaxID=1853259 RepID=UPI0015A5D931|nr:restriction endonuclease [Trichormus sp. NMC-1]